jgi:hypothetical protein
MRFETHLYKEDIHHDAMNLLEFAIFMDDFGKLDEGIFDKIKDIKGKTENMLKNMGFHTSQSKGLIYYLWTINKNIVRLLYHAISLSDAAEHQREASQMAIKEIARSVTKEEVINFLYKLDAVTLGILTTPLKVIDGITGWHIAGEVKTRVEPAIIKAKKAIEWLESAKDELEGKLKIQLQKYVNALRRVFNFGDFKKVTA